MTAYTDSQMADAIARYVCIVRAEDVAILLCAEDRLRGLGEQPAVPWQSIDTAPRDGTEVLLRVEYRAGIQGRMLVGHYMEGGYCIEDHPPIDAGWYFWNGRIFDRESKPTHWMPLPVGEQPAVPREICDVLILAREELGDWKDSPVIVHSADVLPKRAGRIPGR